MSARRDNDRGPLLTRRALLLAGGQLALFGAVAGRLYQLQVVQASRYVLLADENRISIRLIAPPRGRILDRFGVALAANRPTYRAVLIPDQAGDIGKTLDAVATLVPLTDADRRRVLHDVKFKHGFVPVVIHENMSWDEMARIQVNTLELPGVSIEEGLTRSYPFGDAVSHVLGYVAAVSEQDLQGDDPLLELPDFRIGKNGIEKTVDLEMRGTAGTSQVEVNAFGQVVRELAREDGMAGQEIVLSLDMALQSFAAQRCAVEESVALVCLDAWTGEVLAMVSCPAYDPSAFAAGLTAAEWKDLVSNPRNPLSDKAISGTYAPGSTFKPMVALAALEAGVITPETRVNCPGHYELGNARFHCWKHGGHGPMALRDGIKHSCDVYFFEVARRVGIDRIAAMAKRFGLGASLGIEIPGERAGLIPTSAWKKATFGVSWQQGETLSCGIGQSYVTTTPLQLATMAARLATGRAIKPHLLRDNGVMVEGGGIDRIDFPSLGVSEKDRAMVLDGMFAVVNEQGGTAYAARIKDAAMAMCGKSGTSQVRHITEAEREHGVPKESEVPWKDRDHALFISVAPASAPRYVCAVVVEHGGVSAGGGSAVAAPICRDVLIEAQKRDPVHRIPAEPFGAPATVASG
jgi:penicillin-binding protein 2